MTNVRAVAVILLQPEYRPTDPYPPHAPDDPERVFESYEDYWDWLEGQEIRVAIHDPLSRETDVRRIARPTINLYGLSEEPSWNGEEQAWNGRFSRSLMCPMGAGLLFVGRDWAETETRFEFCRYSTESELVPPEAVVTIPQGYYGIRSGYIVAGQQSVAICRPGSPYDGSSGLVYVFTPDPEDGGIPLAMIEVPNFKSGTYRSDFACKAGEMGEQLSIVSTEIGF